MRIPRAITTIVIAADRLAAALGRAYTSDIAVAFVIGASVGCGLGFAAAVIRQSSAPAVFAGAVMALLSVLAEVGRRVHVAEVKAIKERDANLLRRTHQAEQAMAESSARLRLYQLACREEVRRG